MLAVMKSIKYKITWSLIFVNQNPCAQTFNLSANEIARKIL